MLSRFSTPSRWFRSFMSASTQAPVTRVASKHGIGGTVQTYQWQWQGQTYTVVYETSGEGIPVLLLPAFSTVSTRSEMRFLAEGASESVAGMVRGLVRSPLVGQALYQANTTPAFLRLMYKRHVYVDQTRLTPEFIAQRQLTQQPGARFAPAAFVTGRLDPVTSRTEFLELSSGSIPMMVIIGNHAPPSSTAEMAALAALPGIQTQTLPGTLGLHEEYAAEVADVVLPFLNS